MDNIFKYICSHRLKKKFWKVLILKNVSFTVLHQIHFVWVEPPFWGKASRRGRKPFSWRWSLAWGCSRQSYCWDCCVQSDGKGWWGQTTDGAEKPPLSGQNQIYRGSNVQRSRVNKGERLTLVQWFILFMLLVHRNSSII